MCWRRNKTGKQAILSKEMDRFINKPFYPKRWRGHGCGRIWPLPQPYSSHVHAPIWPGGLWLSATRGLFRHRFEVDNK